MATHRRLSREELAARIRTACRTIAIEEGHVPTIEGVLAWDIKHGESPHVTRSSLFKYISDLQDVNDPRSPFLQHLSRLGIVSAVMVDGVCYEEKRPQ